MYSPEPVIWLQRLAQGLECRRWRRPVDRSSTNTVKPRVSLARDSRCTHDEEHLGIDSVKRARSVAAPLQVTSPPLRPWAQTSPRSALPSRRPKERGMEPGPGDDPGAKQQPRGGPACVTVVKNAKLLHIGSWETVAPPSHHRPQDVTAPGSDREPRGEGAQPRTPRRREWPDSVAFVSVHRAALPVSSMTASSSQHVQAPRPRPPRCRG